MALTETIRKSTAAIRKRRTLQESKRSAQEYAKALTQLVQASDALKIVLDCAAEMKTSGVVGQPLITWQARDELLECANGCGKGVFEGTLTSGMAAVLKAKSEAVAGELKIVWKDAAVKYSAGTRGYLSMIGSLSADPKRARALADTITKTVESDPTVSAIKKLAADVAAAGEIIETFALNPEIEGFLKKVSSQRATIADLTPPILTWLKEKNLSGKLNIRF